MMIQNEVSLRHSDHKYFDRSGIQYLSWSKFSDLFFPVFDPSIAGKCAGRGKYAGMTEAMVLASWDKKRDAAAKYGTRIHDALEYYNKNFKFQPGTEDLNALVQSVFAEYKAYNKIFSEECLYTKYGVAGTCDKFFIISSSKNSSFDLEDFKTNLEKGIQFYPEDKASDKWCKYPIEHLPNCNYTRYALQLSMYAYMAEELTGRKCRKLQIRYIPPQDKLQHVVIPVPYMKKEIQSMLEEFREMNADGRFSISGKIMLSAQPTF